MGLVKKLEETILNKKGPFEEYGSQANTDIFFDHMKNATNIFELEESKIAFFYESKTNKKIQGVLYLIKPTANKRIIKSYFRPPFKNTRKTRSRTLEIVEKIAKKHTIPNTDVSTFLEDKHKSPYLSRLESCGLLRYTKLMCPLIKIEKSEKDTLEGIYMAYLNNRIKNH